MKIALNIKRYNEQVDWDDFEYMFSFKINGRVIFLDFLRVPPQLCHTLNLWAVSQWEG